MKRIVLGTLPLCRLSPADGMRLLDAFVEAGGVEIDTAAFYGHGYAEQVVGAWLRRVGPVARVTTKVGHFADPADYQRPGRIRAALDGQLERLGEPPAALLLHEADWACWSDPAAAPGMLGAPVSAETVPAWSIVSEVAVGLGCATGVSGNNAGALAASARALGAGRVLVAKQYDLLWRDATELLADRRHEVWLGAPLHQGHVLGLAALRAHALTRGDRQMAAAAMRLSDRLTRRGLRPIDVAVPFALAATAGAVCVGVADERELAALAAAADRDIEPGLLGELLADGLRRPPMPGPGHQPEYAGARWT